jgi:hypothetical protein
MRAEDREYDSFAIYDSVPQIVHSLDAPGSRFLAIFTAFIGIDTAFLPPHKDLP